MIKEAVVISGKGGTGKTSITSSFAVLGGTSLVIGDCDVDADDMHLMLNPDYAGCEEFRSGFIAAIDSDACSGCGRCMEICRFRAVTNDDGIFGINELNCEGCGYCAEICPVSAISMKEASVGNVYHSTIRTGARMIHARLKPGADNSGKLVAKVKKDAREAAAKAGKNLILIDGSPGIGCPVVSSLTGADYVLLVTEPTKSGVHDVRRVYELVKKFRIRAGLIINKHDLNNDLTAELESFAEEENIKLIYKLPYDENFTKALTAGVTVAEFETGGLDKMMTDAWETALKDMHN